MDDYHRIVVKVDRESHRSMKDILRDQRKGKTLPREEKDAIKKYNEEQRKRKLNKK